MPKLVLSEEDKLVVRGARALFHTRRFDDIYDIINVSDKNALRSFLTQFGKKYGNRQS